MSVDVRLFTGDCRDVIRTTPTIRDIDFVYLDPPFDTGRTHRGAAGSFDDSFDARADFLAFMRERLECIASVMKPDATIMLHCDWRTSHHLRVMLDELFGVDAFVNHLIWTYGLGGSSPRRFARKHDDILFYAKSPKYYFEPPLVPATSQRMRGQMKKATDVIAIPSINNMAHERVGWPTQKPLALLRLLIDAACPPGGSVLDPFCGSGTTLVAASENGRPAIGIDVNPDAIQIAQSRCAADVEVDC